MMELPRHGQTIGIVSVRGGYAEYGTVLDVRESRVFVHWHGRRCKLWETWDERLRVVRRAS